MMAWIPSPKRASDGEEVTLGFDGSRQRHHSTTDASALVACGVESGHVFVPEVNGSPTIWEAPPGDGKGWQAPRAEIDQAVREVLGRFTVGAFYCDPHEWRDEIALWERDFASEVRLAAPGAGGPFHWWPTERSMTDAIEAFYDAISHGSATHDANPILRRHALAAHRYPTRWGFSAKKEHPSSARKIDALVAAAQAWAARLAVLAAGPRPMPRSGVVWGAWCVVGLWFLT